MQGLLRLSYMGSTDIIFNVGVCTNPFSIIDLIAYWYDFCWSSCQYTRI